MLNKVCHGSRKLLAQGADAMELPLEDRGTEPVVEAAVGSMTVVIESVIAVTEGLGAASIDWLFADACDDAAEVVVAVAGSAGCSAVGEAVDGLEVVSEKSCSGGGFRCR